MEEQPKAEIDSLENIPRKEFVPNFGSNDLPTKKDDRRPSAERSHDGSTPPSSDIANPTKQALLNPKQLTIWGIVEAFAIILLQQALMIIFTKIFGIGLIISASYAATVILFYYIFRTYIMKKTFHIEKQGQKIKDNIITKNIFDPIYALASEHSSVTREFGSSALSFAWLASGKIDCLFTYNLNKNQVACGELLIKESGGYLTNLKYIHAYKTSDDLLIGANPTLHKELLKKINNRF